MRGLAALAAVLATAALASTAAAAPTKGDIVVTATKAGQFTTLTKLVKVAGLTSTLKSAGPFTVFAPTDAAFAKVPKSTLNALLHDRTKLKAVLLYHVVKGKVTARQAMMLKSAATVEGQKLRLRTTGGTVFVNNAKVVTPNVAATNGVIHVIDRVLIPPR